MPVEDAHRLYENCEEYLDKLRDELRLLGNHDSRFEWEIGEILQELALVRRYLDKPGEVLYCNWSGCKHKDRALRKGEGAQWFKGRVHPDCARQLHRGA